MNTTTISAAPAAAPSHAMAVPSHLPAALSRRILSVPGAVAGFAGRLRGGHASRCLPAPCPHLRPLRTKSTHLRLSSIYSLQYPFGGIQFPPVARTGVSSPGSPSHLERTERNVNRPEPRDS